MTPLLSWRHVSKSYGATRALTDVSLTLEPGKILGLLGPNGSGKTTLLSIGCGLDTATSGTVDRVPGERVGFMPQEYGVYPTLTALDNLLFVARAWGCPREGVRDVAERALASVQLSAHARKRVSALSGGMKRRLSFAAATLGNPKTLLLDEPATGMDPQSRLVLLDAIRQHRERGSTVLYSTHHMDEVEAVADEVAILNAGEVLVRDTVRGVIERYGEPSVEVEYTNVAPGCAFDDVGSSTVVASSVRDGSQVVRYRPDEIASCLRAVMADADARNLHVNDIVVRNSSLETAFIALTGRGLSDGEL